MNSFRFWAAIVVASILSLIGFLLANVLPLPEPATLAQTRLIYASLGALLGILMIGRVMSWIVRTFTRFTRQLILRLASEMMNQLSQFPFWAHPEPKNGVVKLSNPIIIDTSALIDGRVLEVVKTGFLSGIMLIPNFVLVELQQVADSADPLKRARGRRGFEIIEEMKKVETVKVEVWDKEVVGKTVDEKLVRLGKILKGRVLTCDFNLNRMASTNGVVVLNVNELANSLKSLPVPGERLDIKIIQLGRDKTQGVGYLPDGTMVVVKDGSTLMGQNTVVEVTKILQGSAGRMIFGKIAL